MPELPEVETTLRAIEKFQSLKIHEVKIYNRNLRWKISKDFESLTIGQTVNTVFFNSRVGVKLLNHVNELCGCARMQTFFVYDSECPLRSAHTLSAPIRRPCYLGICVPRQWRP